MSRRWNIFVALSLIPLLCGGYFWKRSARVGDLAILPVPRGALCVGSVAGHLALLAIPLPTASSEYFHVFAISNEDYVDEWEGFRTDGPAHPHFAGFHLYRGDDFLGVPSHFILIALPFWFVILIFLTPMLAWCRRWHTLRSRRRRGLCQRCGYDLRHSPGRCPECGASAATPAMGVA